MRIKLPSGVKFILNTLTAKGKEAYIVGGCVRDTYLGRTPHDWDICTAALPEETISIFEQSGYEVIPTGLRHGTVTVLIKGQGYEVTTFREDGDYSDSRRPDSVKFVQSLQSDLARRDFTMNAMAYSPAAGLVDPFNGRKDIKNKVIRCVGRADSRFCEDGLRIMRALRFAAVTGFALEDYTRHAAWCQANLLGEIAWERKQKELVELLRGEYAGMVLRKYKDILVWVIPEIRPCFGFSQNNPYHAYDVWEHTVRAVETAPTQDIAVRLTLLLHDLGKPYCYEEDENGVGHFHGHGEISQKITRQVLARLRFDTNTLEAVSELVGIHDRRFEATPKAVRKFVSQIGPEQYFRFLEVRAGDIRAQAPELVESRMEKVAKLRQIGEEVLLEKQCLSLRDLAVNGHDLIAAGMKSGPEMGRVLNALLDRVIEDPSLNEKNTLLELSRDV